MKTLTCQLQPSFENETLFRYKFNMKGSLKMLKTVEIKHLAATRTEGILDLYNYGSYISPFYALNSVALGTA